jgi:uncharacterized protein DUF177 involved in 23S rRNA accumulation
VSHSPPKPDPHHVAEPHAPRPWSAPLRIEDVPETGRHVVLTADERTRQAIAAMAGLRGLPRVDATFDVVRSGHDGLHITGQVSATVGQTCVVTLEPIEREMTEALDLVFRTPHVAGEEASASLDTDEVEPLVDGTVDLGVLATEFLILGIDPYPRKPDVVFQSPPADEPAGGAFAALAALQKKPGTR